MSWEPPAWSEGTSIDQQVREYRRRVGEAQPQQGRTAYVEIAQLEEIDCLTAEPIVLRCSPVVQINGIRFEVDQAAVLNAAISEALRLLSGPGAAATP